MKATNTFSDAPTKTLETPGCAFLYRELGDANGIPLVLLQHFTGVLDDWDPGLIESLAQERRTILFDNRGVGGSSGDTPDNVSAMARDAITFIEAMGLTQVDLLGFSMGGFAAQVIAHDRPDLVRRLILAGTGPAGGAGINQAAEVVRKVIERATAEGRHPKEILFFSQTSQGKQASLEFLARLRERDSNRDLDVSNDTVSAQLSAITAWGNDSGHERPLEAIRQPVLVVNGDDDIMVPTINSIALFQGLSNAELSIFPDAGHGGIFQYRQEFAAQVARFLGGPC